MAAEREQLLQMGMPESVAERGEIFSPTSVGVIVHTGDFVFEERVRKRSGEPEVLLVRQADKLVYGVHPWGIPAGKAEQGERIIQVAFREVLEETGMVIDYKRLRWFCSPGDRQAILSYQITLLDIPLWNEAEDYEMEIKVFPPASSVNTSEIDRLALVPVETFADHMVGGPTRPYRKLDLLPDYLYYPKSHEVNEEVDFVLVRYKEKIWQEIRHQMFVRKIIPAYLG